MKQELSKMTISGWNMQVKETFEIIYLIIRAFRKSSKSESVNLALPTTTKLFLLQNLLYVFQGFMMHLLHPIHSRAFSL